MQQHPVPSNITGFEFKLVGFLTLKQFLYLAGAGVLSFVIFVSVGSFLRWLLIAPIMFLGAAVTFLPVNGMAFDKWVVVFIRAVTSPTRRVWRKEPKTISFLDPRFSRYLRRPAAAPTSLPAGRHRLEAFLAENRSEKQANRLDNLERTRLGQLHFSKTEHSSFGSSNQNIDVINPNLTKTAARLENNLREKLSGPALTGAVQERRA